MAGNRDLWDAETDQYVCGFDPDGPFDPTVLVGRVTDRAGAPLATLVNYACHATTLGWQSSLIGPDFPGATREVVEEATGAPCVFLQGASGDTGPREGFWAITSMADRNGRELGYAALSALESLPAPATTFRYAGPSISGTTLGLWDHVPFSDEPACRCARWECRRWTVPSRTGGHAVAVAGPHRLRALERRGSRSTRPATRSGRRTAAARASR